MTWAAGVRREIISDRARSSSSTPDGASGGATCHTCAGAALDHACRRFVLPWAGHVCWSAPVCGDRRPLAVKARPGTPSVRCGTGPVWTASLSTHRTTHQQQHRTAPHYEHLRHRSAPHRARASIGRRGRLSLHSSYIKRPRSSSLQGASVCAPTDRPQRTSLQRQRRRRPRVGHRHAPEGEKENPRLARNGSEERTKGKESARLKRGRPAAPRPRRPRRVSGRRDGGAAPFSRCTRRRRSGTPR